MQDPAMMDELIDAPENCSWRMKKLR